MVRRATISDSRRPPHQAGESPYSGDCGANGVTGGDGETELGVTVVYLPRRAALADGGPQELVEGDRPPLGEVHVVEVEQQPVVLLHRVGQAHHRHIG